MVLALLLLEWAITRRDVFDSVKKEGKKGRRRLVNIRFTAHSQSL